MTIPLVALVRPYWWHLGRFTGGTGATYPIRDQKGVTIDSTSWMVTPRNRKDERRIEA